MSGIRTSTWPRNGRLITAFLVAVASVSLLSACGAGNSAGGEADPAEAIVGTWGSTATGQPYLTFGDDGKVSGSDGCNGVGSTYTVDGDTITLDKFYSTLRACIGVDTWLRTVKSVQVDGDAIIVRNAAGDEIGSLDRNDG